MPSILNRLAHIWNCHFDKEKKQVSKQTNIRQHVVVHNNLFFAHFFYYVVSVLLAGFFSLSSLIPCWIYNFSEYVKLFSRRIFGSITCETIRQQIRMKADWVRKRGREREIGNKSTRTLKRFANLKDFWICASGSI